MKNDISTWPGYGMQESDLKKSLNQLALYLKVMPKDHFSVIRRRADNFTLSYMTRLDPGLLRRVEKLYEVDFEMFGYSPYLG